ncbi:hypothetical protein [Nocardiopsis sp. CC223A]|uniref:hypothetical protein n=1 Tax=Nocardiopsis sp. CC223A TaxID=3044051 RepID=UPI00278BF81F|nr:hypothetical protein [Nocardiopsis sp. CC223A]
MVRARRRAGCPPTAVPNAPPKRNTNSGTAIAASPDPAGNSRTPTGIDQRIAHRSPRTPNSGCTTDDADDPASTIPAAAA